MRADPTAMIRPNRSELLNWDRSDRKDGQRAKEGQQGMETVTVLTLKEKWKEPKEMQAEKELDSALSSDSASDAEVCHIHSNNDCIFLWLRAGQAAEAAGRAGAGVGAG
jgi:hypothetical protein